MKLEDTLLFQGVPVSALKKWNTVFDRSPLLFERGASVCTPGEVKSRIFIITEGECEVYRSIGDGGKMPLNTLGEGDAFGILSMFSEAGDFPSRIRAKRRTAIAYIEKDEVLAMMADSFQFSYNLLSFVAGRALFLNKKIAGLSPTRVEDKVRLKLLEICGGKRGLFFPINVKSTAEGLRIGRASLYRALQKLSDEGIISYADGCFAMRKT